LGYSQVDSPLAGWFPVVGVYGVSFLVVLSTAAFVAGLARTGRARRRAVLVAVLPWLAGFLLALPQWTRPAGEPLTTTVVQGGIRQDLKWLNEQRVAALGLYAKSLAAHPDSDLIVWPEVAIPFRIEDAEDYLGWLEDELEVAGQSLALGILQGREDTYNSVLLLDGDRWQVYRKRHLVPFGEYFPVPDSVREWMRMQNLPYNDMSAG